MGEVRHRPVAITIDHVACEGTGLCVSAVPSVFSLNDDNLAQVDLDQAAEVPLDELREAEFICPTMAITIQPAES